MAKPKLSGAQLLAAGKYVQSFKDVFGDGVLPDGVYSDAADKARCGLLDQNGQDWSSKLDEALNTEFNKLKPEHQPIGVGVNGAYNGIKTDKS